MELRTITANADYDFGIEAKCDAGYRVMIASGNFGGGTLQIKTRMSDFTLVPVSDAKLASTKLDDNGDQVQQVTFSSLGTVIVTMAGATNPNLKVWIG